MELKEFNNLRVGDTVMLKREGTYFLEIIYKRQHPGNNPILITYIGKNLVDGREKVLYRFDDLVKIETEENEEMEKYDVINKPDHYTNGKIEVIDYIEQITSSYKPSLVFSIGNVIKYVSRAPFKNGLEDLKKAKWYLDRAIKKWESM